MAGKNAPGEMLEITLRFAGGRLNLESTPQLAVFELLPYLDIAHDIARQAAVAQLGGPPRPGGGQPAPVIALPTDRRR